MGAKSIDAFSIPVVSKTRILLPSSYHHLESVAAVKNNTKPRERADEDAAISIQTAESERGQSHITSALRGEVSP